MPPEIQRGPVRARDLRANIKALGFDQGVVITLEALLDEFASYRQNMRDMADLLSMCINQVETMVAVGTGMQNNLKEIIHKLDQGDAIDHGDA
ncbi:MAG TPA: hypothetical protein VGN34_03685 [Ktedonobacteraceae bacterium]